MGPGLPGRQRSARHMSQEIIVWIALIVMLGIAAQWLAWFIRIPSILVLLVFGIAAGPLTGLIDPDAVFGKTLLPMVSLAVAVILFEGGLSLRLEDLRGQGAVINRLVLTGTFVTWLLGALAARYILGFATPLAILLGAILIVTGPTVIIPLLRQIRPSRDVACVLRWEAIVTDPLGAVFAVLVFEAMAGGRFHELHGLAALGLLRSVLAGGTTGLAAGYVLIRLLRRYLVPDFMQNAVTLLMVLGAYTLSNLVQPESGLLAVTLMGAFISNRGGMDIGHIVEFKENLRVLLISVLFIVLAARLKVQGLSHIALESLAFTGALIVVVRPLAVLISTLGSSLSWAERAFVALVAPRGIVAAAVASVFALRLSAAGETEGAELLSVTFFVIIATVVFYGLGAGVFARILGVAEARPWGFLIIGASPWVQDMAAALQEEGVKVVLVDTNHGSVRAARTRGLAAYYGSGTSEAVFRETDMEGIGRLLAMTPNSETNTLAVLHFKRIFNSSELYQLPPPTWSGEEGISTRLHGRLLFCRDCDYWSLSRRFAQGARIEKTAVEGTPGGVPLKREENEVPLFLLREKGQALAFTTERSPRPMPGDRLIKLVAKQGPGTTEEVGLDY